MCQSTGSPGNGAYSHSVQYAEITSSKGMKTDGKALTPVCIIDFDNNDKGKIN
jgi:hypothetical protein